MKATSDRTRKLCDVLRREAKRQDISNTSIGKAMGTTTSQVCTIFSGRTGNPGVFTIAAMLRVLGRDFEWLQDHMGDKL